MRALQIRILCGVLLPMMLFPFLCFAQNMEIDTDRPGMNYKSFDLPSPDPKICENACKEDSKNCKAWTYVKPGMQGTKARCWLKSGTPSPMKNPSCISGVIQPVSSQVAQGVLTEKREAKLQRQTQAESSQILSAQIQPSQLPKETKFKTMIEQKLQEVRTAVDLRRKSEMQQHEKEIAVRMKRRAVFQGCDNPVIKSVFPTNVYPGESILIEGCGFTSKQGVVTLTQGTSSAPWLQPESVPSNPVFPEFDLLVDSWTDTAIKGRIPDKFSKPLLYPISLRLGVVKDPNVLGPSSSISPTILLQPEMEIRGIQVSPNYFLLDQQKNCLSFMDFVPVGAPMCGVQNSTPKIMHFSNYNCAGKDTIYLQRIQLRNYWTFQALQFYSQCMILGSAQPSYSDFCGALGNAVLDQNLGDIKGKQWLPNVTVSWNHNGQSGIAYTLLILVGGAKGTVGADGWVICP